MAAHLERIDGRLERIDGRFERLEGRVDGLEATVDAAALDEELDDAGYRPAVTALANRLGNASLPDEHGFEDGADGTGDADGTDDVECDDAIDGDDATEGGMERGDGSRSEGGA